MSSYEYKVVPAPSRGTKGRGVSGPEGRFAHSLEIVMNEMAADGWEYQRAETLPSEEKSGLVHSQTVFRNVLVFRRKRASDLAAFDPRALDDPRQPPLLMAPPAGSGAAEIPTPEGGLSGLLRRRAAGAGPREATAPGETEPETFDDLASRFTEDAEEAEDTPAETATGAAPEAAPETADDQKRSAAE